MSTKLDKDLDDLKEQFERAVAPWHRPGRPIAPVHFEQTAEGQWLFSLHLRSLVPCRFNPPRALWLANRQVKTKPDLCLVGGRYKGANLLVFVEAKLPSRSLRPGFDSFSLSDIAAESHPFAEPVRNVAATRSWRALVRILRNAAVHEIEDVANQNSDLGVVIRALEQPEAIVALGKDDPLAAARLRGLRERERLLSEEGGVWTAAQVAKHLGVTRQTINLRRKQGLLVGIAAGRHGFNYPAWQFVRGGTIEGLEPTLAALKHLDPWMQQAFMLSENIRLNDRRAIDVLREGDISSVTTAATAFGEHGAA